MCKNLYHLQPQNKPNFRLIHIHDQVDIENLRFDEENNKNEVPTPNLRGNSSLSRYSFLAEINEALGSPINETEISEKLAESEVFDDEKEAHSLFLETAVTEIKARANGTIAKDVFVAAIEDATEHIVSPRDGM